MGYRGSQFYVPHALPAHFGPCDFHATAIAYHAPETNALVFAAIAFEILRGAKYAFAEKAILLWLESALVYGLWLGDLTIRPRSYLLRRGQRDANGIEIVNFEQPDPSLQFAGFQSSYVYSQLGNIRNCLAKGHFLILLIENFHRKPQALKFFDQYLE